MGTDNSLIGLIPAAGRGIRMRPLSDVRPKALLIVAGKNFIERAIETLQALGVSKIVIVVGYLESQIKEFLSERSFPVPIVLVSQREQLGLCHAISAARTHLTGDMILYCPDSIYTKIDDLARAKRLFLEYAPTVLQVATVRRSKYGNRSAYFTENFRNIAPNLYFYEKDARFEKSAFQLFSVGITFLSQNALDFLPTFFDQSAEYEFPRFLSAVMEQKSFLLYLLRGFRYDFSEPADINLYNETQNYLANTTGSGVSVVLINKRGEILLHLRDDKPTISYPNHWALVGGGVDGAETPCEALVREIKEEIALNLVNFCLLREYTHRNKREYAFLGEINVELSNLKLNEGREVRFFEPSQLINLKIRPDDKQTLDLYLSDHASR